MKITMITGKAGSGKDTYAEQLIKDNPEAVTIAFADYLKFICAMIGWDEVKDEKGRTLLQDLGEAVNQYNNFIWSEHVIDFIEDYPNYTGKTPSHFIITDLRLDHEYEYIREAFPEAEIEVVRVVRHFSSKLTPEQQEHVSEAGIKDEYVTHTHFNE